MDYVKQQGPDGMLEWVGGGFLHCRLLRQVGAYHGCILPRNSGWDSFQVHGIGKSIYVVQSHRYLVAP